MENGEHKNKTGLGEKCKPCCDHISNFIALSNQDELPKPEDYPK